MISKNAFIRKVKDITIGSSISLALLGSAFMLQSCGSSGSDDEGDYEEVETYTRGVKTYITETSKGVFRITDEVKVPIDSSVAIVTYLSGKKDTLHQEAVKALIDSEIKTNPHGIGQSNNLSNALLYGGMGYMLANIMGSNNQYSFYRGGGYNTSSGQQYPNTSRDTSGRRHYGSGTFMRYYASRSLFNRSQSIQESVGSSRVFTSRPSGGRSGFFHSTGRSFGG
ncbi:hypothetical protein SAMN04515674_102105 [Pseudarcicella hirudinis]|uniref:UPF0323 domain-containing protein n=1 Tax=Pseudarcicella hirudinis TaxID=1079859 RepID=A0A1I5NSY8_9BACT|nr:hypothetical protein [Pseudarcicella hirudinis]SFP24938.1 hypothetical protein SAMN04515674_102105 [Pseudarcicella hirudinis]